jgi:PAS domain S-box-containing protein
MEMIPREEQLVRQALRLLNECGASETSLLNTEAKPAEVLVEQLNLLVERQKETAGKFARQQKEIEAYRDVSADSNRMLEQKIEEISLLRLITDASGRAMQTKDPLRLILGKIVDIAGAENGFILTRNGDARNLEIHSAGCGPTTLEADGPLREIVREVAEYSTSMGEAVFVDNVSTESRFNLSSRETEGIGSLAAFPLVIDDKTVGVLILSSPHPNTFGAETQRIMLIITGQIAVAIENARLYAEVRKTKEYLEDLVARAGDAIFTLDSDHRILSWNAGAEAIFKQKKQEILGESLYTLLPETISPVLREKIQSIFDSENILTIESDLDQGNGSPTRVTITLSPIHVADDDVVGVSGIAKDISKRRELENELRELNAAKSNFVSTVSHELRTPVTSIKSLTEVLSHEMDSLSEDNVARYLNIINEECDHLSELISGLLDLQALSAGKLEADLNPIRMVDVVTHVTGLLDGIAAEREIELTVDSTEPDHMTVVMGDRGQLIRILSNLLSNAFKYSKQGAKVAVQLSRENESVKLTVTDNGIGIPDDKKEKIFEKFYRVDNSTTRIEGGTGLGLPITRELVELHNGSIRVEDAQGGGCRFTVLIPAAERSAE